MTAVDLIPRVKGPLKDMEAAAIEAVKKNEKFRTTVALESSIALTSIRLADLASRDFSNFVQVILADHAKSNPSPAAGEAELFAKLAVVLRRRPVIRAQLEKIATHAARASRARSLAA